MAILTVDEAQETYFEGKISKGKIYDMIRKKQIPVLQISSRKHFFNTVRLDEWMANDCIMPGMTEIEHKLADYGTLRQIRA